MSTKTRLPAGVNSWTIDVLPQDMTQLPPGSLPALPQHDDLMLGAAVSLTSSTIVAVMAASLIR